MNLVKLWIVAQEIVRFVYMCLVEAVRRYVLPVVSQVYHGALVTVAPALVAVGFSLVLPDLFVAGMFCLYAVVDFCGSIFFIVESNRQLVFLKKFEGFDLDTPIMAFVFRFGVGAYPFFQGWYNG